MAKSILHAILKIVIGMIKLPFIIFARCLGGGHHLLKLEQEIEVGGKHHWDARKKMEAEIWGVDTSDEDRWY